MRRHLFLLNGSTSSTPTSTIVMPLREYHEYQMGVNPLDGSTYGCLGVSSIPTDVSGDPRHDRDALPEVS